MQKGKRIATAVASLAVAAGGLLAFGSPASASPSAAAPDSVAAFSCDAVQYLTGSRGHKGASVRCYGASFTEWIDCQKPGLTYRHFGNRAVSGGVSTTWCDLDAKVVAVGFTPS